MSKPFKTLVAKMSPDAQERAKARTREMLLEMNLQELRLRCAELTQEDVAQLLDVTQAFGGLVDLMNEQQEKVNKASSGEEESRYSQRTMDDLRENLLGTTNIYASVLCRDPEALFTYLATKVAALPGTLRTETAPVIRTLKRL